MSATIKDIARCTGLSIATISKYINGGNVLEKNRTVIEQAISELNYSVNEAARNLKTKHTGYVGLLLPALTNQFMMAMVNNIQAVMRAEGWGVSLCCLHSGRPEERKAEEKEAIQFLMRKGIDGLINMPMNEDGSHLTEVIKAGIPVTLVDKHITELSGQVNSVVIDNVGACRQLTDELLNAGHRNIIAVFSERNSYTSARRYEGYVDACRQRGFEPDPKYTIFTDCHGETDTFQHIADLVQGGATAILTAAESQLREVLKTLKAQRITVPDQVSIASFDGGADSIYNDITAAVQPKQELSTLAAQIMCQNLRAIAEDRLFPTQLCTLNASIYVADSIRQI